MWIHRGVALGRFSDKWMGGEDRSCSRELGPCGEVVLDKSPRTLHKDIEERNEGLRGQPFFTGGIIEAPKKFRDTNYCERLIPTLLDYEKKGA